MIFVMGLSQRILLSYISSSSLLLSADVRCWTKAFMVRKIVLGHPHPPRSRDLNQVGASSYWTPTATVTLNMNLNDMRHLL